MEVRTRGGRGKGKWGRRERENEKGGKLGVTAPWLLGDRRDAPGPICICSADDGLQSIKLAFTELCGAVSVLLYPFLNTISLNSLDVTIRPDFIGTVLNYDGPSRENDEVSLDAELSRIPNPVPILSRFECDETSHVDKVHRPNTYTEFVVVRCVLSSLKCTKFTFSRGALSRTPLGELTSDASADPLVGWGWDTPFPSTPFGVSISAPSARRTVSRFSIIDLWSLYPGSFLHPLRGGGVITPQLSYNTPRDSSPDTPLIAYSSYFGRLHTRGLSDLTPTLRSTPPQLSSPRKLPDFIDIQVAKASYACLLPDMRDVYSQESAQQENNRRKRRYKVHIRFHDVLNVLMFYFLSFLPLFSMCV